MACLGGDGRYHEPTSAKPKHDSREVMQFLKAELNGASGPEIFRIAFKRTGRSTNSFAIKNTSEGAVAEFVTADDWSDAFTRDFERFERGGALPDGGVLPKEVIELYEELKSMKIAAQ